MGGEEMEGGDAGGGGEEMERDETKEWRWKGRRVEIEGVLVGGDSGI
jgi:hypothetical protein